MTLEDFFRQNPRAALAFSGGTDSSYLLYAGLKYGADVRAYTVQTSFQPQFELEDASRMARSLGAELTVLPCDILAVPEVAANPQNRCYYCKKTLFSVLRSRALQDGYPVLLDGTNASDDASDRPGMRALRELGVRSPLRECGLGKPEIRRLSREAGLFTWDKPAYACLATRIPAGVPLAAETLKRVEEAEGELFSLGFTDFRVRVYGGAARIQVPAAQMEKAVRERAEIRARLSRYFEAVLLDLQER